ncbi:MAG: hypothetical protein ABH870_08160 [bacterium]
MAFKRDKFNSFSSCLKTVQGYRYPEARAIAENFILEERLTEEREDSYSKYIVSPGNLEDWKFWHENEYLPNKIKLCQGQGIPQTFTDLNSPNLLLEMEQDQYLIRVENLAELAKLSRSDNDIVSLSGFFIKFLKDPTDQRAADVIEDFLSDCNRARDLRPIFVGFWGEVKDLLQKNDDRWANKVRDRFGLGHFNPEKGESIPVLLLRYRVADVIAMKPEERNFAAIPTVLDSSMSPFFCPTPKGWTEGQTLDLRNGGENDYAFNCEILHRFIEYKISHVYRFGWITESPGKTCEEARRIHMKFLENDFKYFDQL